MFRRGVWRRASSGIIVPDAITLSAPLDTIGDVSTANAGIRLPGTGFTRADGSSIVQAVYFGSSLAIVTATTSTQLTLTSPLKTIGTWDITVTDIYGRSVTRSACWDAWGWVEAGGWHTLYISGIGYTMNGGTVQVWADQSGNGHDCTFVTLPTPVASDAGYNNAASLDLAGGCYGDSSAFTAANQPNQIVAVGNPSRGVSQYAVLVDGTSLPARNAVYYNYAKINLYAGASANTTGDVTDAKHMYWANFNTTSSSLRVDDSAMALVSSDVGTQVPTAIRVGKNYSGSFPWGGKLIIVGMRNSAFDAALCTLARRYSAWKYGTP